ncbi:Retrovirus-related Pol polyprotein from transposon [Trichinella sp. T8]|nr:Retrovirus-related Pol polyprotein from transposon [Trichinella sp. T8]
MSGDVHTSCRTCTQCARKKGPCKNNRTPMQSMAAGYLLQRVGMDILGPLENTSLGDRCVLVLLDYFTKWTAAFTLANMEASTVAKVLVEKYIAYFGAPDYLPSHQGCSFEASVVLEMCRLFGIKKTRSFPYHPQGNGQAERFKRTLLDMLSILVDGHAGQWDDILPFVMLAYNSSVHESPGITPAIAMLGRESRLSLDVQIVNAPGREALGLPDYIPGEGPPEDAATSPKVPARPTRQGVTLLSERPREAGDATKREARPWMGGAVPGSGGNGAANVPRTAPLTGSAAPWWRDYLAAGTLAACCRLSTIVKDEGRKAGAKTAATWLPARLHPLRNVRDELLCERGQCDGDREIVPAPTGGKNEDVSNGVVNWRSHTTCASHPA